MKAGRSFQVLLFDLGGVLVDFAGFEELGYLLPDAPDRSRVRQQWIDSEAVRLFERGEISSESFANRFLEEWALDLSPGAFLRELDRWRGGLYPGAARLLERLRKTHRLAYLSNSNEVHAPAHRENLDSLFDHSYFSHELGLLKPEPEIFEHAIRDLAVPPGQIAFFDDTAVNVVAAVDKGMSAHLVGGMPELEHCLERLGLPTSRNALL
jgi:putative hydrolase of the HAD superfamily